MSEPVRSRRLIALFAAYVVALQALLLPLTVAAGAAFDGSLCAASAFAQDRHQPAGHDTGCACAAGCGMQCCVQALAGPPHADFARGTTRFTVIRPLAPIERAVRPSDRSPQVARAPPAV